jgi:hypothetical protein
MVRIPRDGKVAVSVQEEASRDHYIVRNGTMPGTPFLGEYMRRVDGHTTFDGVAMRADTLSAHELLLRYRETHDDMEVMGFAGFGNVTMNPRFMAYIDGRLVYTRPDLDDPDSSFERPNPSVIVRRNGAAVFGGVQFRLGRQIDKQKLGIADRKWLTGEGALPGAEGEFQVVVDGEVMTRDDVVCVIQGPPLVAGGRPVEASDVGVMAQQGWFYDLRHIIRFPYVKLPGPPGVAALGVDVGLERLWSGQGLNRQEVARALRGGIVSVPLEPYNDPNWPYVQTYGRPVGSPLVVETLGRQSYVDQGTQAPSGRDQFRLSGNALQIRYGEGIYNHSVLGLSRDGELLWLGLAGLGGRAGLTMAETATLAALNGMENALLIDNGGDVMLNLRGEWVVRSGYNRTRIRGLLIFAAPAPKLDVEERYLPTVLF